MQIDTATAVQVMATPSSPTTSTTSSHTTHGAPIQGQSPRDRDRESVETLKHQLRLSKAEIANLQAKLGLKPNPAPFGSSLGLGTSRRGSDLTSNLSLSPPPPTNRRGSTSPDPHSHSHSNGIARSPSPIPSGLGPVPGTVSLGRVLLEEEGGGGGGAHLDETTGLPSPPLLSPDLNHSSGPSSSASRRNGGSGGVGVKGSLENPFFGSGASGRERVKNSQTSAQSGSGKVISGLQSDLLAAKSSLESTRSQLRLSQKAVEFLTRQNEDLKESKDRLTSENSNLTKMLSRKDRLVSESLVRTTHAESSLLSLQSTHSTLLTSHESVQRELGENRERKEKAEMEYEVLREGMRSLEEGWRDDLEWLKKDLGKLEGRQRKELDEARLKHETLAKLFESRESSHKDLSLSLSTLAASQVQFQKDFENTLKMTIARIDQSGGKEEEALRVARELEGEFKRLRRMMREYKDSGGGDGEVI